MVGGVREGIGGLLLGLGWRMFTASILIFDGQCDFSYYNIISLMIDLSL